MQVERRNGRAGYEAIHVGAEEKTRVQFDSVLEKTANQHNPGDVASRIVDRKRLVSGLDRWKVNASIYRRVDSGRNIVLRHAMFMFNKTRSVRGTGG